MCVFLFGPHEPKSEYMRAKDKQSFLRGQPFAACCVRPEPRVQWYFYSHPTRPSSINRILYSRRILRQDRDVPISGDGAVIKIHDPQDDAKCTPDSHISRLSDAGYALERAYGPLSFRIVPSCVQQVQETLDLGLRISVSEALDSDVDNS